MSHPPSLLPNPCAPAAFFWLDFLCGRRREGKREERRKDERKGRKEGAQSVPPAPTSFPLPWLGTCDTAAPQRRASHRKEQERKKKNRETFGREVRRCGG